jgi:hypothetical protein
MSETAAENQSPYIREVTLPSRGIFYDGQIPEGRLIVKAMTAKEERIIAGSGDGYLIFNQILAKVINFPKGFSPSDLITTDKLFLSIQLRNLSYGSPYEFDYSCRECKAQNKGYRDLDKLELLPLPTDWDESEENPEPFELKLPSGPTIKWRFLRGTHEEDLLKYVRNMARRGMVGQGDPEYIRRIALHIVDINGKNYKDKTLTLLDVVAFVENLYAMDTQAIRNDISKNRFGLDFFMEERCKVCGASSEFEMPFTPQGFFRAYEHDGTVSSSE